MELFGKSSASVDVPSVVQKVKSLKVVSKIEENDVDEEITSDNVKAVYSFADLGLCDWICKSTSAMGFRKPTDIQKECIPAILGGRDVLACAETGSGKTAAFALPILQKLSEDPYGIFAIILTPTRELAIQIKEQITSLGASFGVRIALVIGGVNIIEQGIALSKRPHIVIATPGRMRHHLQSADAPDVSTSAALKS
jgi:ATP-dependent RNA helicase DDX49/DBP8